MRKENGIDFRHYNSKKEIDNLTDFLPLLNKLSACLENRSDDRKVEVIQENTPQQKNNDNCGVYVCAIIEWLAEKISSSSPVGKKGETISFSEMWEIQKRVPHIRAKIEEWNKKLVETKEGKLYIDDQEITSELVEGIIDYYDIPGINRELDCKKIKQNLKAIELSIHPDKWRGAEIPEWVDELLCLVINAKEILGQEHSRQKYDFGLGWEDKEYVWYDKNDLNQKNDPTKKHRNSKELVLHLEPNSPEFIQNNQQLVETELKQKGFSDMKEVVDWSKTTGVYNNQVEVIGERSLTITECRNWKDLYSAREFSKHDGQSIKYATFKLSWILVDLIHRAWKNKSNAEGKVAEIKKLMNETPIVKEEEIEITFGGEIENEIKSMVMGHVSDENSEEAVNIWLAMVERDIERIRGEKENLIKEWSTKVKNWDDFSEAEVTKLQEDLVKDPKWKKAGDEVKEPIIKLIKESAEKIKTEAYSESVEPDTLSQKTEEVVDDRPIKPEEKERITNYLNDLIFTYLALSTTPKTPTNLRNLPKRLDLDFVEELSQTTTWGQADKIRLKVIREVCEKFSGLGGSDEDKVEKIKKINKDFFLKVIWPEIEAKGIKWNDLTPPPPPHQNLFQKLSALELSEPNFARELINRKKIIINAYKTKVNNMKNPETKKQLVLRRKKLKTALLIF